jgi:hypothetical protein
MVLIAPTGLIGEDSPSDVRERFVAQIKKNLQTQKDESQTESARENAKLAGDEFKKYVLKNPLRAVAELNTAAHGVEELIAALREKGVGIAVIQGVEDSMFSMDKVQANIEKQGLDLDGFISVEGGHNKLYRNPEKMMALAEHVLLALEAKREKRDSADHEG